MDLKNEILLFNTFHLRYYMAINVKILILAIFGGPFFKGAKIGPKGPKKLNIYKDLKNKILLFNTFHLIYYMAIYVNILILHIFGGSFF